MISASPMRIGVDGCRAGWFAVIRQGASRQTVKGRVGKTRIAASAPCNESTARRGN